MNADARPSRACPFCGRFTSSTARYDSGRRRYGLSCPERLLRQIDQRPQIRLAVIGRHSIHPDPRAIIVGHIHEIRNAVRLTQPIADRQILLKQRRPAQRAAYPPPVSPTAARPPRSLHPQDPHPPCAVRHSAARSSSSASNASRLQSSFALRERRLLALVTNSSRHALPSSVCRRARRIASRHLRRILHPLAPAAEIARQIRHSSHPDRATVYRSCDSFMCGISIAIVELFSTIVQIGTPHRTAVSKSSPVMPNAASPMKFTQNLSGAATFAPIVNPNPVPSWCDFPHPRYDRAAVSHDRTAATVRADYPNHA